jgi:hypothetical protein
LEGSALFFLFVFTPGTPVTGAIFKMLDASPPKVYPVKNGCIGFICPACGFAKSVNVEGILQKSKDACVRIRCRCRKLQKVLLDRRGDRRKPVEAQGLYFFTPPGSPISEGEIFVKDLSHAGLGFKLQGDAESLFGVGDMLSVQFKLFATSGFLVKKEAIVKRISDHRINAAFREPLKNEDNFLLKLFFYT